MLRRAEAYCEAGADALLVHSKKSTPDQIIAFANAWDCPCPLIIVPTKYYSTPVEVFDRAGISIVIWANHNVRSAIVAMRKTSRQIFEERSLRNVEDRIAPVEEVFRLQDADELAIAEDRYLPQCSDAPRAVVLAASRGNHFGMLTNDRPKTMIPISGTPLLHTLIAQFQQACIKHIVVVRGYGKEMVDAPDVEFIDSEDYDNTGELVSLNEAYAQLNGDIIISFGDILFRKYILNNLLAESHDIVIVVDAAWEERNGSRQYTDYIAASRPYSLEFDETPVFLQDMAPDLSHHMIHGEWIGLAKATAKGALAIRESLQRLQKHDNFRHLRFKDLFRDLLAEGNSVQVLYITGHWLDVDNLDDLTQAQVFHSIPK